MERKKIEVKICRRRKEFGAPVTYSDNIESLSPTIVDFTSYEDESFKVTRTILDKQVQHSAILTDNFSQTDYPCPRNAYTQHVPRTNTDNTNDRLIQSSSVQDFFTDISRRMEEVLQQNATVDVFVNDYRELGEEEENLVTKGDNHLREYQSFADIHFSKKKTISQVQWHPTVKGQQYYKFLKSFICNETKGPCGKMLQIMH